MCKKVLSQQPCCWMLGRREMFYLTTHSTHFIYGYMASDIWLRTILIVRKETRCCHIGYSYRLTARFFYMHHPTDRITHTTAFVTPVVEHWLEREIVQWVHPMKDRSDDPSHHEQTLLPRSYISLLDVRRPCSKWPSYTRIMRLFLLSAITKFIQQSWLRYLWLPNYSSLSAFVLWFPWTE